MNFKEYGDSYDVCPHCGTVYNAKPVEPIHLAPGTILADRYIIGMAVGSGGFGIVYKAWDSKLETIVAVKETFFHHFRQNTRFHARYIPGSGVKTTDADIFKSLPVLRLNHA